MERAELLAIMTQCGLNEEAANKIVTNVDQYISERKRRMDENYERAVVLAKQVVLAETASWKAKLAQKTGLFLEATVRRVEAQTAAKTAMTESKVVGDMQKLRQIVEGAPATQTEAQAKIKALEEANAALTKQKTALSEQYKSLRQTALTATQHSSKLEKQNTALTEEVKKLKTTVAAPVLENKTVVKAGSVTGGSTLNEDNTSRPTVKPKKAPVGGVDPAVKAMADML